MKTLKEMRKRGTKYLIGYTDALKDFVDLLMDPKFYDRRYSGELLKHIDEYINDQMKEEREYTNKLVEED